MARPPAKPDAGDALRLSEERYRAFVQNSSEGIWCCEVRNPIPTNLPPDDQIDRMYAEGYLSECNDAMARMYGLAGRADLLGARLGNLLVRSDPNNVAYLRAFISSGYRLTDAESHERTPAGEERYFANNLIGVVEDGRLVRAWGTQRDITSRRTLEEALRESDANQRALIENAAFGIYRSTSGGSMQMANQTLARMLGYDSAEDLVGKNMGRDVYFSAGDREHVVAAVDPRDPRTYRGVEVVWRRRDGSPITVRISARPVLDASAKVVGFEGIVEDVTERRTQEHHLRQAQKMQAVGQLAGGIAHDFNNLLSTIVAAVELLRVSLAADAEGREDLDLIAKAAMRGADLTRKLLAFSRRQRLELVPRDVVRMIEDFHPTLRRLLPETVAVRLELPKHAVVAHADSGAMEQIVINLATNSRDAMRDHGTLTIQVGSVSLDRARCDELGWGEPGDYALLTVSDTGAGMDEATRQHIFEPFFTTKPVGSGTGLGMPMVYGLVKQHHGFVQVESEPGRLTTVSIYLPAASEGARAATPRRPDPTRGGRETILVAEDEESLRRATRRILERQGYTVLVAADGAEALDIYRAHRGEIALIMSDVVMPRLGGAQLWQAIQREGTPPRVLFTSGYTDREGLGAAALPPDVPFLPKPWTIPDLLTMIRELLDAPAAS